MRQSSATCGIRVERSSRARVPPPPPRRRWKGARGRHVGGGDEREAAGEVGAEGERREAARGDGGLRTGERRDNPASEDERNRVRLVAVDLADLRRRKPVALPEALGRSDQEARHLKKGSRGKT